MFRKISKTVTLLARSTITKYQNNIAPELIEPATKELEKINTFEFNIFELDKLFGKKCLFHVLNEILNQYNYIDDHLVEKKYVNFINEISEGYNRDIPYHNDLHATDVLQTTHLIILKSNLAKVYNLFKEIK